MRRNFNLILNTGKHGSFSMAVSIELCSKDRIQLKNGWRRNKDDPPRRVHRIDIISRDPTMRVNSPKDIEHICEWKEIEKMYETGNENDDGTPEFVIIDKTSLNGMFPSTPDMNVTHVAKLADLEYRYIGDKHYFLNLQKIKQGKNKIAHPEHVSMYNTLWHGLAQNKECLFVKYYAMNTCKDAIVYAGKDGLFMSNIIQFDHQKERRERQLLSKASFNPKLFDKLTKQTRVFKLAYEKMIDEYSRKLEELVQATINGDDIKVDEKEPVICSNSHLDSLLDSSDDESESESSESDLEIEVEVVQPKKVKRSLKKRTVSDEPKRITKKKVDDRYISK